MEGENEMCGVGVGSRGRVDDPSRRKRKEGGHFEQTYPGPVQEESTLRHSEPL